MNDFEDLEDELRSFRPVNLPAEKLENPLHLPLELRGREQRRAVAYETAVRKYWQPVMWGALAAACIAVVLSLEVTRPAPRQQVPMPVAAEQPAAARDIPPTTGAYMQAFAESPEKLEQLLSMHGAELLTQRID